MVGAGAQAFGNREFLQINDIKIKFIFDNPPNMIVNHHIKRVARLKFIFLHSSLPCERKRTLRTKINPEKNGSAASRVSENRWPED